MEVIDGIATLYRPHDTATVGNRGRLGMLMGDDIISNIYIYIIIY